MSKKEDIDPVYGPDYGHLMTLEEFKDAIRCGAFIDDDGVGVLATADYSTDHQISPSAISTDKELPEWVTHIVWYNK